MGRLTLVKSVLNNLPMYYMSMFKMPKSVASKIVQMQRRFFWGDYIGDKRSIPSVKWSLIELPKEMGGLGVGNIMYKNLSLIFKWWWRFYESDNSLWKTILISVHSVKGFKASSETFRNIKDGMWAQLLNSDSDTSRIRSIVEEGLLLSVGRGDTILF